MDRKVVGIVADPGLAEAVAEHVAARLPRLLSRLVDDRVEWEVDLCCEATPLVGKGEIPLVAMAEDLMRSRPWDAMVCLTELPRFLGTEPLISSLSLARRAALVSLPALGWLGLRRHTTRTVLYLLSRILRQTDESDESGSGRTGAAETARPDDRPATVPIIGAHDTLTDRETESHVARPGVRSKLRLLAGMVRHNRPWRLVPSLDRAIAAAAATTAFPIFYSSIWGMANQSGLWRLLAVNVLAVGSMVGWLVVHNDLWERTAPTDNQGPALMYNLATCLTLLIGVVCMYVLLFALTMVAATVVISAGYLGHVLGHPADVMSYVKIAWIASSMGTVAGALGAGLESEASIRQATYSRRVHERWHRAYPDSSSTPDPEPGRR